MDGAERLTETIKLTAVCSRGSVDGVSKVDRGNCNTKIQCNYEDKSSVDNVRGGQVCIRSVCFLEMRRTLSKGGDQDRSA
jgi:hypothetical protein